MSTASRLCKTISLGGRTSGGPFVIYNSLKWGSMVSGEEGKGIDLYVCHDEGWSQGLTKHENAFSQETQLDNIIIIRPSNVNSLIV